MTLRPSLFWLLLTLAVALVAMYLACRSFQIAESAIAAAVFSAVLCASAIRTNAPHWRREANEQPVLLREAMRTNVLLIALAFLWCAAAFYAIYLGTAVRWQHGWEYGTACLLLAAAYGYYALRLANSADAQAQPATIERMTRIIGYQAILIAIGLVWLVASGKLAITHKGDWAANQLFLAGGFAIMCISVILIKTNAALSERRTAV
ncbi:MAG: hypothetical protein QM780_16790 [Hyphomicrobium sp.]|uniref:hypothetical protein n=1 Tax=Hyphomicrobium sp. TaxID=82 RepID=UPI0039E555F3